jgi:hypothetical protein
MNGVEFLMRVELVQDHVSVPLVSETRHSAVQTNRNKREWQLVLRNGRKLYQPWVAGMHDGDVQPTAGSTWTKLSNSAAPNGL